MNEEEMMMYFVEKKTLYTLTISPSILVSLKLFQSIFLKNELNIF